MIKVGDFFMFNGEIEVVTAIQGNFVEHNFVFPPKYVDSDKNYITKSHIQWVMKQPRVSPEEVNKLKAQKL